MQHRYSHTKFTCSLSYHLKIWVLTLGKGASFIGKSKQAARCSVVRIITQLDLEGRGGVGRGRVKLSTYGLQKHRANLYGVVDALIGNQGKYHPINNTL